MQVTRRSLLKSGILASAGHVAADNFPLQRDADAAISASRVLPDQSGFEVGIEDPVSPVSAPHKAPVAGTEGDPHCTSVSILRS